MTLLFDTHAHYDSEAFDPDREQVLQALPQQGVGLVLNPGCNLRTSRQAVALAHQYPYVYAAVGIHPEDCAGDMEAELEGIAALCSDPRVKAIGEIGLDYHWEENPLRQRQQEIFRQQMALAQARDLPVIVHDRDAHADSMAIVREFPDVRGVFHCFSGSAEMARQLVDLGWMLSFTGVLTYKNARRAVEAAAAVPLERLMIETDSPYMAPEPCRGQRNDSTLVRFVAKKLAEIKGLTPQEVIQITAENGKRFFRIEHSVS